VFELKRSSVFVFYVFARNAGKHRHSTLKATSKGRQVVRIKRSKEVSLNRSGEETYDFKGNEEFSYMKYLLVYIS
jgi:hypothetical protein